MPAMPAGHILPLPEFDRPVKLLIAVAPFYKDVTDALLAGAMTAAAQAEVTVIELPGVQELPSAIALAERMTKFDGYVALGCVIRGETSHYDTLSHDSSHALTLLGLHGAAIGNGILTVDNHAQAVARANPLGPNKGGAAVAAALHLIALSRKWASDTKGIGFRP